MLGYEIHIDISLEYEMQIHSVTRNMVLLALIVISFFPYAYSQATQPIAKDPQAVSLLGQVLNVAGGLPAITTVRDFMAKGKITLYHSPQDESGTVTIKGRGMEQFRMEVSLPEGVRTAVADRGTAWTKETDGKVHSLLNQRVDFAGSIYFPFEEIANWLADSKVNISDLGITTVDGKSLHAIRARKNFLRQDDPMGTRGKLSETELLVDPTDSLLIQTSDKVTTRSGYEPKVPHSLIFSDYRKVDGVLFAFSVVEEIYHQRTVVIQFDQVTFNTGLNDSDFEN